MKHVRFPALVALATMTALASSSCSLDEPQAPSLTGPSTLGVGIRLTASPDLLLANGFDTAVVQAHVQDQNGRPLGGRDIVFTISDAGGLQADIGSLRSRSGQTLGTSVVERSDGNGLAQVVYEAPARTDVTANTAVLILARQIGSDASGELYRQVRIELRSAEPRLFPTDPTGGSNAKPFCSFAVQSPSQFRAGTAILFQDASSDSDGTIVRYEWYSGAGQFEDSPDTAFVYPAAGTYTVTHVVTDNFGAQTACAAAITIF